MIFSGYEILKLREIKRKFRAFYSFEVSYEKDEIFGMRLMVCTVGLFLKVYSIPYYSSV